MSQTEQEPRGTDPFDPFGYWKAVRDSGMDAWSKVMLDFVHSDAYARASAEWLDTYLSMSQPFQRMIDQAMTQTLSQWKLPSTEDITRLADRMWNVELRLDDLDARVDEMLCLLRQIAGRVAASPSPAAAQERTEPGAEGRKDSAAKPAKASAASASAPKAQGSRDGDKGRVHGAEHAEGRTRSRSHHGPSRRTASAAGTEPHEKGK